MNNIRALAAVALAAALGTAAIAQTKPGGNLPQGQGPCERGYTAFAPNGRLQLGAEEMKTIDLNSDGNISRTEFDAACAKGLFDDGQN